MPSVEGSLPSAAAIDVAALLESSRPRPRLTFAWYAMGLLFLLLIGGTVGSAANAADRVGVEALSLLAVFGLTGAMMFSARRTARQFKRQHDDVEAIDELVQLRQWPAAADTLVAFLSEPAKTPRLRVRALIALSSLLVRREQLDDALRLQSDLIDGDFVDEIEAFGLRVARAMTLLRLDRLLDADRAISDLRRRGSVDRDERPAAVVLVELFRDVKTGHPEEAVTLYESHEKRFRQQLGHRSGDAHALAARAYDMLGRGDEAAAAYDRATLLVPAEELKRRYAELAPLVAKYSAAAVPAGLSETLTAVAA